MLWFKDSPKYKELDGLDGEPVEFEWKMFPGHTTQEILREIKNAGRMGLYIRRISWKNYFYVDVHVNISPHKHPDTVALVYTGLLVTRT